MRVSDLLTLWFFLIGLVGHLNSPLSLQPALSARLQSLCPSAAFSSGGFVRVISLLRISALAPYPPRERPALCSSVVCWANAHFCLCRPLPCSIFHGFAYLNFRFSFRVPYTHPPFLNSLICIHTHFVLSVRPIYHRWSSRLSRLAWPFFFLSIFCYAVLRHFHSL